MLWCGIWVAGVLGGRRWRNLWGADSIVAVE